MFTEVLWAPSGKPLLVAYSAFLPVDTMGKCPLISRTLAMFQGNKMFFVSFQLLQFFFIGPAQNKRLDFKSFSNISLQRRASFSEYLLVSTLISINRNLPTCHLVLFYKISWNFSECVSGIEDELVWNANQDIGTSSLCLPITPGPPVLKSFSELPKSVLLRVLLLPSSGGLHQHRYTWTSCSFYLLMKANGAL